MLSLAFKTVALATLAQKVSSPTASVIPRTDRPSSLSLWKCLSVFETSSQILPEKMRKPYLTSLSALSASDKEEHDDFIFPEGRHVCVCVCLFMRKISYFFDYSSDLLRGPLPVVTSWKCFLPFRFGEEQFCWNSWRIIFREGSGKILILINSELKNSDRCHKQEKPSWQASH